MHEGPNFLPRKKHFLTSPFPTSPNLFCIAMERANPTPDVKDDAASAGENDRSWKAPSWLNSRFFMGVGLIIGGAVVILIAGKLALGRANKVPVVAVAQSAPRCHFE
jgi:hypothetical protein